MVVIDEGGMKCYMEAGKMFFSELRDRLEFRHVFHGDLDTGRSCLS